MWQHPHSLKIETTQTINYLLSLPESDDSTKKWPLILFLHGSGERGSDLERLKKHGIPKVVEERSDFPFITVSPQCPENEWWLDKALLLKYLLDEIVATYNVDATRIYLTGISMGGYGVWQMATTYPEQFSAVVPICGGGYHLLGFPEKVGRLRNVPLWVFHGAKDSVVPLSESEELVHALKNYGGNVKFTIYPEAEHDAWTETYNNPALYRWLLAQTRQP